MLRVPFCTALVLSILSCDGSPSPSDKGQDSDSGGGEEVLFLVDDAISLTRDTQGVAHVSALTRRGMFYGYGYASAQDRMFQMDYFRRKAGGRLAEFLWIDGEDDYNQGLLDSDIEYRTVGTWAHAQTVVEQPRGFVFLANSGGGIATFSLERPPFESLLSGGLGISGLPGGLGFSGALDFHSVW